MAATSDNRRRARIRRHNRVRKNLRGTPERPRVAVYRSNRHMSAQLIDDTAGVTLAAASTLEPGLRSDRNADVTAAARVGSALAERAAAAGIDTVVFDRGGFRYHGRVAALAAAAREGGLKF